MRAGRERRVPVCAPAGVPPRRAGAGEQGHSAALLVRVWTEGSSGAFRARLTTVDTSGAPPAGGEVAVAVAASQGEVLDAVRAWLDRFAAPGP